MKRIIGLMSGTSLDGVDVAMVETDGEAVGAIGPSLTWPYPAALRTRLRHLLDSASTLQPGDVEITDAGRDLTLQHVAAIRALNVQADLVGFHGQTILHRPHEKRTWQIGDAALLAAELHLPVAWDFRSADVAAGGQGAPLVPVFHAALSAQLETPLAVLNVGGVANVTWLGRGIGTRGSNGNGHGVGPGDRTGSGVEPDDLVAWDCGPGNALLDDYCLRHLGEPMDRDGLLAASGTPDELVLADLLAHPFFRRPAPKSLDRQDFAGALRSVETLSVADGAATLAAFTARAVAASPWPSIPRRVLVTGGGRLNPAIMAALRDGLPCSVDPVETVGWNGDALEAQCFAFLAARVERGLPMSFPGTTGVPCPMPGGAMAFP